MQTRLKRAPVRLARASRSQIARPRAPVHEQTAATYQSDDVSAEDGRCASGAYRPTSGSARERRAWLQRHARSGSILIAVAGAQAVRGRGGRSSRNSGVSRMSSGGSRGKSHSMTSMMRPGPRRHHHDAGREEHRLGDRVGDEEHRLVGRAPRAPAAARSDGRGRSRRARRTARPSAAGRRRRQSARAIEARCCMPPESCQGNLRSKPVEVDQLEVSAATRCRCSARGKPMISSGSATLRRDGAPGIERRRLEHVAVGARQPRLLRRHAVDA